MRRIAILVVTASLGLSACGTTSGSAPKIPDLRSLRTKLEAGGFSCTPPKKPTGADADTSFGQPPKLELACKDAKQEFRGAEWTDATSAKTTLLLVLSLGCGFGMKNFDYLDGGAWIGTVQTNDNDANKAETATLAKASRVTGIAITHHTCPKRSGGSGGVTFGSGGDTTTTEAGPGRNRGDALQVGTAATIGDYRVTMTKVTADATTEVRAANDFNDPPKKGQYLLATYTVTYRGKSEGQPGFDLTLVLSGSDHVQYDSCGASVSNGEPPTLETGGTTTITDCIDAPPAAIRGGVLFVKDSFGEHRAYWNLPG